jgi:Fur family ferric uptake transcriptional regulator
LTSKELQNRGVRLTRQRRAVLAALGTAKSGLDPAEVLERARVECPELGLATVYRALDLFHSLGIVRRIHTDKRCATVAAAEARHGHYVVCTSCGRVAEFSRCDIGELEQDAARQTGFAVNTHFLELAGVCGDCQARSPARNPRGRAM